MHESPRTTSRASDASGDAARAGLRRSEGAGCRTRRRCLVCGQREAGIARTHALSREEPFDEDLAFLDLDEKVRPRLGEDGPRIVLADPVPGPFETPVQTFNLPAHLFPGHAAWEGGDQRRARVDPASAGGLILKVGGHRLIYDRTGIRRAKP